MPHQAIAAIDPNLTPIRSHSLLLTAADSGIAALAPSSGPISESRMRYQLKSCSAGDRQRPHAD
jgi:hypothetical protein